VLFLNNDVRQMLTMNMTLDALERSYRGLATGETVCRPRIDIRIPTDVRNVLRNQSGREEEPCCS
jgi:hypothetical protein